MSIKIILVHLLTIVFSPIIADNYYLVSSDSTSSTLNTLEDITNYIAKGDTYANLYPDSSVNFYKIALRGSESIELTSLSKAEFNKLLLLRIDLQTKIGIIHKEQYNFSFANDNFNNALLHSKQIENDSLIAECEFNIAETYLESGDYAEAITSYNNAIKYYRIDGNLEGEFWSLLGIGIVYKEFGNVSKSISYYSLAKTIAQNMGNLTYVGTTLNNIANLLRHNGKYDEALTYLLNALESFKSAGNERYAAHCLLNLGNLYCDFDKYDLALEYYFASKDLSEKIENNYLLFACYANIADTYAVLKDNEKAILYFHKTLELVESEGDKPRLGEVYVMLSEFYKVNKNYQVANQYIEKSLNVSREIGDTLSLVKAYIVYSDLLFEQNRINDALNYASNAYEIAILKELKNDSKIAADLISKIWELKGNYKLAFEYNKIANEIKDSLFDYEKIKIAEEAEARYNLANLEKEKLLVENDSLIKSKELQMRNIQLGVLIIFILGFSFFGVRFLRKKRREKQIEENKNIQLKRKIDLLSSQLDAKNRELTSKAMMISKYNSNLEEITEAIEHGLNGGNIDEKSLRKLSINIKSNYTQKRWDEFIIHFEEVHPGFYKKLTENYSDLSANELRICAFIRMNLNTKDIAELTGHTVKSVEVARTRIRKKLNIDHNENLTKSIMNI